MLLIERRKIVAHLCNVYDVPVVKAHVIKIGRSVVVYEEMPVDRIALGKPPLLLLSERSERGIGNGNAKMLVRNVYHVEFSVFYRNFRRPKSPFSLDVFLF